jgi:hypothetical protein
VPEGGEVLRGAEHPDPRWRYFFETVLVVRPPGEPPFEIDLRRTPRSGLGEELARRGLAGPFAVITAYNPFGHPRDAAANSRRDRELAVRLATLGSKAPQSVAPIRVDGRSPDGSHVEPGYGVLLPLEEARALAREFGQTAIFWWDGEDFWIVEAVEEGRRVRLPG